MRMKIFAVYDSKAQAFLPPFFMNNGAMAIRAMQDVCSDPSHQFNKHPMDFGLFGIGEFDDENGFIESYAKHVNYGLAASFNKSNGQDMLSVGDPALDGC